jgi:sulfur-oxidizing protein SoxY
VNDHSLFSRRRVLLGLGAAASSGLWTPALARQSDVDYEIRQLTRAEPVTEGRVSIDMPRHSDAGTSVPMTVTVESPMTADDYVASIHVFATENPRPRVLNVYFTPLSGKAEIGTRIRLDGAQLVIVIARMSDGSWWRGETQVGVTFGACSYASPGSTLPDDFVPRTRISVPEDVTVGDLMNLRAVITHPQETGLRLNAFNQWVPLRIIEQLSVKFLSEEVIRIRPEPAISTNPYFSFYMTADGPGRLEFEWLDTTGDIYAEAALISPHPAA